MYKACMRKKNTIPIRTLKFIALYSFNNFFLVFTEAN